MDWNVLARATFAYRLASLFTRKEELVKNLQETEIETYVVCDKSLCKFEVRGRIKSEKRQRVDTGINCINLIFKKLENLDMLSLIERINSNWHKEALIRE